MKKTRYQMKFLTSLNEEQENTLIGHIQSLINTRESVFKLAKDVPISYRSHVLALLDDVGGKTRLASFFSLEKVDEKTYIFEAPDVDEIFGIPIISNLMKRLPENKIYEKFLKMTIKDMKINVDDYSITKLSS